MGKVMVQRKDGGTSYIADVLYVLSMKNNLLSLGQLLQKCYHMTMQDNMVKIFGGTGRLILKAPLLKNRAFKIDIQVHNEQNCLDATMEDESWLRNHQFGHLSFKNLGLLSSEIIVTGNPRIK
jgi:hypothetical protein